MSFRRSACTPQASLSRYRQGETMPLHALPFPTFGQFFNFFGLPMRPRSRPFMVEIKSSKRTAQPASAASSAHPNNSDDLIPSGDLPARDIQPFVSREALREAEKLFGRFGGDQPSVHTTNGGKAPVFPDAKPSAVRVLPDLLAAAREHERTAALIPKRKRVSSGLKTVQRRRKALVEHRMLGPDPAGAEQPKNHGLLTGHAEAAMTMSRRRKRSGAKLSPGERWKERRLPRVCWDRRRARTQ